VENGPLIIFLIVLRSNSQSGGYNGHHGHNGSRGGYGQSRSYSEGGYSSHNGYHGSSNYGHSYSQGYGQNYSQGYGQGYGQNQRFGKYDNSWRQSRSDAPPPPHWDAAKTASLPSVRKDLFQSSSAYQRRTSEEADSLRRQLDIMVVKESGGCPAPLEDFSDVHFPEVIKKFFSTNRFKRPTAIQAQGWPVALSGKDLVRTHCQWYRSCSS
jgi:ATP-dependent RNA helicase DDX5/DBP2